MTAAAAGDGAAWDALLPDGTVWLSGGGRAGRRLRMALAGLPQGASAAVGAPPWALRRHGRAARRHGDLRRYIALPARGRPVIVASDDPAVLRYVADAVLCVPPGAGPVASLLCTGGLRLLRRPATWIMAAALRAVSIVVVGRPG